MNACPACFKLSDDLASADILMALGTEVMFGIGRSAAEIITSRHGNYRTAVLAFDIAGLGADSSGRPAKYFFFDPVFHSAFLYFYFPVILCTYQRKENHIGY